MNYNEALDYIHSVSNFFCKPGLERIRILCDKLGNPQDKLRFVHVAGTNGKGSFCAMLSSVLTCAGYKTGLYTSPYILNFNERIQIDGKEIENSELSEITERVKKTADTMEDSPTEFELITAIAFEYFAQNNCDIVVLECGLGGKYDATNIIKNSVLSVITSISIDHTSFLGNTVESIAAEKAGIIKSGIPCLWCGDDKTAYSVIDNQAKSQNSVLFIADKKAVKNIRYSLDRTLFDWNNFKDISLRLLGSYQPQNASNVIYAVRLLNEMGFKITEKHLRNGLKSTVWHARFEVINADPLIIADGAHNKEGIDAAINSIDMYFMGKKADIITGVMQDKDFKYIAKKLTQKANRIYCITPNNPRALKAEDFARTLNDMGAHADSFDTIENAVQHAVLYATHDIPIIALGSLYMYSDVLKAVKKYKK